MKGLVIGMGRTGLSITRHWRRLGYTVDATDSRPRPPAAASFSGHCDGIWCDEDFTRWPRQRFDGYDAVAVSPGVAPSQLPLPRSRLTNDVALFDSHWRRHCAADTRLLAVTGTNGKSTVTALAAHLARRGGVQAEAIGNLGEPMLDALLRWRDAPPPSLIVAELSSFQLEIAGRFRSDAAVVLNLSEDHLDRHGTLQRYGAIKRRLYRHTRQAVINLDDPTVASWRRRFAERTTVISLSTTDTGADWHLAAGSIQTPNFSFPLRDLSPAAAAQPGSVLAALALLSVTPVALTKAAKGLSDFPGLPHRRQTIAEKDGVRYVNDSKATNVAAAVFSVENTDTPVVLIAGGDGKGQDFAPLRRLAPRLRGAVLLGHAAAELESILTAAGVHCHHAAALPSAVAAARALARAGDTVLLSPACSSLDQFPDYRARGDRFQQAVDALAAAADREAS